MICGSGGSNSRLATVACAKPPGEIRDAKLHSVVARSTLWSEKCQKLRGLDHFWKLRCWKSARGCGAKRILKWTFSKHHSRTIFRSCDVEKVYVVVRWSTSASQKCQSPSGSEHFWTLRCRKGVSRRRAKHIWKWKVLKSASFGPSWKLRCRKKCTLLWCEACLEVKRVKKNVGFGASLDVQMSFWWNCSLTYFTNFSASSNFTNLK